MNGLEKMGRKKQSNCRFSGNLRTGAQGMFGDQMDTTSTAAATNTTKAPANTMSDKKADTMGAGQSNHKGTHRSTLIHREIPTTLLAAK